ncbi:MAG: 16S rRNA (guanine(966)-N(2))-methyltransferase RsmD [Alkalispirochaeta sp.]
MRISGGTLRGKRITCPPGIIRPAMDRMRESMFSILGPLESVSFLDLFSGSGLVGIEAWSRGARPVVLVERDRKKRDTIRRNFDGLEPPPVLHMEPVERFIQRNKTVFDIVYLDPPFSYPFKKDLLNRVAVSRSVHAGTVVLIHAPTEEALDNVDGMPRYDQRDYGGSRLSFFRVEEKADGGL